MRILISITGDPRGSSLFLRPRILTKPFMRSYEASHVYYDVFLKFNLRELMRILVSITGDPRGSYLF